MAHHHKEEKHHKHHEREEEERREKHHGHHKYEEDREEERYERQEGYGRRTETEYGVDGGGYGRRTESYDVRPGAYGGGAVAQHTVSEAEVRLHGIEEARRHETTYQRTEYLGEAGAALAAGFALYERRQERIDPQNARRHKVEEQVAEGLAVGGAGAALYGHHKKERSEEQLYELETGHKKHGWFG